MREGGSERGEVREGKRFSMHWLIPRMTPTVRDWSEARSQDHYQSLQGGCQGHLGLLSQMHYQGGELQV